MRVSGEIHIVVDVPGITRCDARAAAEQNPERFRALFVENMEFEAWEEQLEKTEDDEPSEEE